MDPTPLDAGGLPLSEDRVDGERRRGAADRREAPRLGRPARRAEDRHRLVRNMAAAVVALCGAGATLYLFLALVGAIDLAEAAVATLVALALATVWLGGFAYRLRTQAVRAQRHDRERRGF